ncbi:LysR family transcriptional regulator [Paraburkholderia sp. BL25I1N1]|uniref:LysR family transcriptional regulator n=1 Tax=Paraburkholderia sp. BL25I1N1 TaxID=1938804 RepID=UPI000D08485B|nr:LysR family transcriptional regulator [Paraburkholderia sp. BL25I1N1]PRY04455.1 LysR family transcriptional regulator [Paraburkholderia sp. BL25I1N1]
MHNFHRLDLNLLVTLDVLLSERNVTRAAARLNLSQPSVSVQLGKLREAFDDPLLLPGARGMLPTPRADELREPLRNALETIKRAVMASDPFDPASATNTWRVAAADYGELAVLLPTLRRLRERAPGTRLAVVEGQPARIAKRAEDGEIDLSLQTMDSVPQGLRAQKLFDENYVLVGRPGHPQLGRRPTIKQFCSMEHVVISPTGGGFVGVTDAVLEAAGLSRRVVLSVPHFLVAISVVKTTDLVAMLPARLVRAEPALKQVKAPVDVPGYAMGMVWHERSHRDPSHQWLREQIVEAVARDPEVDT